MVNKYKDCKIKELLNENDNSLIKDLLEKTGKERPASNELGIIKKCGIIPCKDCISFGYNQYCGCDEVLGIHKNKIK